MEYIYLDWNVLNYVKDSVSGKNFNGPEFKVIMDRLSKKYAFPYTEGHLKDLAACESHNEENSEQIHRDLDFLKTVSKNVALAYNSGTNKFVLSKEIDINKEFKEINSKSNSFLRPDFKVTGENYSIDMSLLDSDDIFKPFLEYNGGILGPNEMGRLLITISKNIDDPDFYKKFRNSVSKLKENFSRHNTIIDQNTDHFKKLTPFFDFIASDSIAKCTHSFESVLMAFCSITNSYFGSLNLHEKIQLCYKLLDFSLEYREKINKKNRPSNMQRDCHNLFLAANAKFYITEDKSSREKAKFVAKELCLSVKILSMSDFVAKFS